MGDLKTVFEFEFVNKLKQKSIRVTTIIILLISFAATCIPTLIAIFSGPKESIDSGENMEWEETIPSESQNSVESSMDWGDTLQSNKYGYVILNNDIDGAELKKLYPFKYSKAFNDEASLREAVVNGDIEKGIILKSSTSYKLIANDLSMYDVSTSTISRSLQQYNRNKILMGKGIDPADVDEAEAVEIKSETETLGKNAASGFAFAYVGMFVIYMIVILYGNSVAVSVGREKNDRTMEILITNTTPNYLIWGKVLASVAVSTLQLLLMIAVLAIGVKLNEANYPEMILNVIREGVTVSTIVVFMIFAVFGTLMYYFLYAAVGALVSKVEEVNSAMTPIQFVFIGAFFLCSMGVNMPDSTLMRVISIVPFTSPMAMFIRYSMATVPVFDLIAGVILLIATTVFMAYLAVRIYRMGTLNYGNRIGFFKAVKMVFQKEQTP